MNTARTSIHIVAFTFFSFGTHAAEDCPKLTRMEISGKYEAPAKTSWNHEVIPDRFIFDIEKIKRSDKSGIARTADKYAFPHAKSIARYTIDDDSRAGVVYNTAIGEVFHSKIFMKRMNGYSCMPGSSINMGIDGLPAVLTYLSSQENKKRCMWNLEVVGVRDDVQYSFHYPVNCAPPPTTQDASRMLSIMKSLMPTSAFKS